VIGRLLKLASRMGLESWWSLQLTSAAFPRSVAHQIARVLYAVDDDRILESDAAGRRRGP